MNNQASISIIILNYNGLRYLKRTIPAILALTYPDCEFIVVDNGSTDGSLEFVRDFSKIKLIQSPKPREKNFACNYSVREARGEYIFLLDNDALITDKNILQELISRYNEETGVIGLSFYDEGFAFSKSYGSYLGFYFVLDNKNLSLEDLKKYNGCPIGFPEGKGLFIAKSKWLKVGGYDDYLIFGGDDTDLGMKLWMMGYKNYLYSKTVQIHLGLPERRDNKKYPLKFKEMFYGNLYTIVKNFTFFNMILTLLGHSVFSLLKAIKQSIIRLHPGSFFAFFTGYYLFLKNLANVLEKRKKIQRLRVIKEDVFLKIRPSRTV